MVEETWRLPTAAERRLLAKILEFDFLGCEALRAQLVDLAVESIDAWGSLALHPGHAEPAPITRRVPLEGMYDDADGVVVHLQIHVIEGFLAELEVFREDPEGPIVQPTAAGRLRWRDGSTFLDNSWTPEPDPE